MSALKEHDMDTTSPTTTPSSPEKHIDVDPDLEA
jgi:hypothetical protein